MNLRVLLFGLGTGLLLAVGVGYLTRQQWRDILFPDDAPKPTKEAHVHGGKPDDHVDVTEQAQKQLQLDPRKPVKQTFHPKIELLGTVVERPGCSDVAVSAPLEGTVGRIAVVPGQLVEPGQALFTIRLNSDSLNKLQLELFRSVEDLKINDQQIAELTSGQDVLPAARTRELRVQRQKLEVQRRSLQIELELRGFSKEQWQQVERGVPVKEFTIVVPHIDRPHTAGPDRSTSEIHENHLEVEDLKIHLGDRVQIGRPLCILADRYHLAVAVRVHDSEYAQLRSAIAAGFPIAAEPLGRTGAGKLRLISVASRTDSESQTMTVFLSLDNEMQAADAKNPGVRLWNFRPDQRLHVSVPVGELKGHFVLPAGAIVQDGVEQYMFRRNGDLFEKVPVQVLARDSQRVVVADDGSLNPNHEYAHHNAAALLRALKLQSGGGHEHSHSHDH